MGGADGAGAQVDGDGLGKGRQVLDRGAAHATKVGTVRQRLGQEPVETPRWAAAQ